MVLTGIHNRNINQQDKTQAAENYCPPPVFADESNRVEVTYKKTTGDAWNHICYLSNKTVSGRIFTIVMLSFPLLANLQQICTTPPHTSYHKFLVHHLWFIMSFMYLSGSTIMTGSLFATPTAVEHTVTISKEGYRISRLGSFKSSWRDFSRLAEESDYFYLVGWRRAIQIPKRAFRSPTEAERFFEAALSYWCEARGLPLTPPPNPDTAGVWPPAPRPGNSAEPGDSPQCLEVY
jgi:hypothetical protein